MTTTDPVVTRIEVSRGTPDDLQKHLQAACNLELWTLPLYLTALASIRSDHSIIELPERRKRPAQRTTVTRLLVSVALQEMYHLQLAGNLARVFGVVPRLDWPVYAGRIPYVNQLPEGVTVELGTANDSNTQNLMVAVESSDESIHKTLGGDDPNVPKFDWIQYDAAGEPCYPSIGTLYSVLVQLIEKFRANVNAGAPQIANGLFSSWYPHTGLLQPNTLDDAVEIIVEQGEGVFGKKQSAPLDPDALPSEGSFEDPFFAENHFSHLERFQLVLNNAGTGVVVWPTGTGNDAPAQGALSVLVQRLLDGLRAGWMGQRPDLSSMFLLRSALAQVFIRGQLPTFAPVGPSSPSYAEAAAIAAPPDGAATWTQHVQYYFAITDVEGMKANHVTSLNLADRGSVGNNQSTIVATTRNAQMPPGQLNVWSTEQVSSFRDWKGE